jgi:dTDP-4-amino-4,6-dideoxy-D-glucose acyltransferase
MNLDKFKYCGPEVKIYEPNIIIGPEKIELDGHILISEYCWILAGHGIRVGQYVHIAPYTYIGGGGKCYIGNFVNIAAGCKLLTGTDSVDGSGLIGPTVPIELRNVKRLHLTIQDYAFLSMGSLVLPGITIGEGAVIGAGAVVTKDVEPWTYNLGLPAKPTGKIRNKEQLLEYSQKLLELHNNKLKDR